MTNSATKTSSRSSSIQIQQAINTCHFYQTDWQSQIHYKVNLKQYFTVQTPGFERLVNQSYDTYLLSNFICSI